MGRFNAKDASTAWEKGKYPATIKHATTTESKTSGKPMDVVTFEVYRGAEQRTLKEYYPLAGDAVFKIRVLASALGASDAFKAETFDPADHIGCRVTLELDVEDDPQYGEKNRVRRVEKHPDGPGTPTPRTPVEAAQKTGAPDDDIPF